MAKRDLVVVAFSLAEAEALLKLANAAASARGKVESLKRSVEKLDKECARIQAHIARRKAMQASE